MYFILAQSSQVKLNQCKDKMVKVGQLKFNIIIGSIKNGERERVLGSPYSPTKGVIKKRVT